MLDEYRIEPMVVGQYMETVYREDIKIDQAVQREFCWTPEMMNSLIYSAVSRKIYIPAIILAEEKKPNGTKQTYVIDAGQRTETLYRFRYEGYRISSTLRNYIITYNKKKIDENGEYIRDKNGYIECDLVEYDIRKTTYEEWPEELKSRLNGCPLTSVIYQDCTPEETAELVLLYNNHMGMNSSQKALTYVGKFADEIKRIRNTNAFLKNGTILTENEKKRGIWERIISESVMSVNFFEDWKKAPKNICDFLNNNASEENFKNIEEYFNRLMPFADKLDSPEVASLFSSKNIFIWMRVFSIFDKLKLPDSDFGDFLKAFANGLKEKETNGENWDSIDACRNTKDKSLILRKVEYIESLMLDFLHIDKEVVNEEENIESDIKDVVQDNSMSISIIDFVKENVNPDITEQDIKDYEEDLEVLTLDVNNKSNLLQIDNHNSLIAIIAYAYENDIQIDDWFIQFFLNNNSYNTDQKENYLHMKNNLDEYIKLEQKHAV